MNGEGIDYLFVLGHELCIYEVIMISKKLFSIDPVFANKFRLVAPKSSTTRFVQMCRLRHRSFIEPGNILESDVTLILYALPKQF
jgi:hypothetical protein